MPFSTGPRQCAFPPLPEHPECSDPVGFTNLTPGELCWKARKCKLLSNSQEQSQVKAAGNPTCVVPCHLVSDQAQS